MSRPAALTTISGMEIGGTDVACSCCGQIPAHGSVPLQCHPEVVICFACLDWLDAKRDNVPAARGGVRIASVEPIFRVDNVERAVDHYQRLGFQTEFHDETYAFALCDDLTIHLAHADGPATDTPGAIYLHVDDADQLADHWRKAGMQVDGPSDTDYGLRDGSHADPDGNLIRFGSRMRPPTSI
jgi:predicted enzyme related to lactoylglutathione lyase